MGNTSVASIRQAGLGVMATVLGTNWTVLEWTSERKNNPFDGTDMVYGLQAKSGPKSASMPLATIMIDQKFSVYLMRMVPHNSGDSDILAAADALMGLMTDVMLQLIKQKFAAPTAAGVMNVGDASWKEPALDLEGERIILEGEITVTFKANYV